MTKEHARSLNQVVAQLLEDASGVQPSRFGVHRRLKLRLTQREHEDITRDAH